MTITSLKTGAVYDSTLLAGNTAFNPTSFESIATATGTGTASTYTFSSIPSFYKSLQIRISSLNPSSLNMMMRINNDSSTTKYTYHDLLGYNSVVYAGGSATGSDSFFRIEGGGTPATSIYPSVAIVDIIDYASTSKNKTIRSFSGSDQNSSTGSVQLVSGLYLSTSSINTLTIFNISGNFASGSIISLYGIS